MQMASDDERTEIGKKTRSTPVNTPEQFRDDNEELDYEAIMNFLKAYHL